MQTPYRLAVACTILMVGVVLGAFAGFPAEAFRWERFSDAYTDQIVVTRAEYDANDGELRVRADSSSATSVLSVYDRGGAPIGVLTRQSATRHEGRFDLASNPRVIQVRSSEGGQATVLVSGDDPPTVTPESLPTATFVATAPPPSATPEATAPPPTATAEATAASPTATAEVTAPPPSATPEASPTDGPPPSPSPTAPVEPLPPIYLPGLFDRMPLGRR